MVTITPEKTAKSRTTVSAPTKWAFENGYLGKRVYDWGCGKRKDTDWLTNQNYTVFPHDPFHFPGNNPKNFNFSLIDTIICNYVLNVIESQEGRTNLLRQIHETGVKTVIIAVRSDVEKFAQQSGWKKYGDGYITSQSTFQKNYTIQDIQDMESILGPVSVVKKLSGGIVAVFQR